MSILTKVGGALRFAAGRSGLVLKKYAPEILVTTGIAGGITASVLAARATLHVEPIVTRLEHDLKQAHDLRTSLDTKAYPTEIYVRDVATVYVKNGTRLLKLYGPSLAVGALSVGCILSAHGILRRRNAALMVAYTALERSFSAYRDRVQEEIGVEREENLYRDHISKMAATEVVVNEDGQEVSVPKDPNGYSIYARFFDELNPEWSRVPEYNLIWLKAKQNYANDLLKARGHIFLNEVYDMLGMEHSKAGAVVGWIISKNGDNAVDFGIFDANNDKAREFVNGQEAAILLDFNVDGVIYDKI